MTQNIPVNYIPVDVFDVHGNQTYDLVFMVHMLTTPEHFRTWHVRYRHPSQLYDKLFQLLKPNAIFVGIAYEHAGGAAIFNHVPEGKKIYDKFYWTDLGEITNCLYEHETFNYNVIVMGRK